MMPSTHSKKEALPTGGVLLFAFLMAGVAWPCRAGSGTEAASFLDIPVGARAASLGAAYSALATDAYAPTWNPGGLGFLDSAQLSGQHLSYLESVHYEYLSFAKPLQKGRSVGISAQYLGTGDMPETDRTGQSLGDFSSRYGAYAVSFGQTLGERLSLGLTAKWVNAKISDVSANAYAADVGAMYRLGEKATLAGVVTNVGSKLKFLNEGGTLPMAFKAALAVRPDSRWTGALEGVYRKTGLASAHAGVEWRPIQMVSLRAGYRTDTTKELGAIAGLTAGMGLEIWGQELAYAWVPYGDLGNTQYFSLLVRFGEAEKAKRNLIHYQNIKRDRNARQIERTDPEYQQLMQLLSDQERELITQSQGPSRGGGSPR
jgi:hypothetical protein